MIQETTKQQFVEKLTKAMNLMKANYSYHNNPDVVKSLDACGCRRNGSKFLNDVQWGSVELTEDFINKCAQTMMTSWGNIGKGGRKPKPKASEVEARIVNMRGDDKDSALACYTSRQLLIELRRRGYNWNEMYVTTRTKITM